MHPADSIERHGVKFTDGQKGRQGNLRQTVTEIPLCQFAHHHEFIVALEVIVDLGIGRADHVPGSIFRVADQVNRVKLGDQFLVHRIIKIFCGFAFAHVFHLGRTEHFVSFPVDVDGVLIQVVNHRFNNDGLEMLAILDCIFLGQ